MNIRLCSKHVFLYSEWGRTRTRLERLLNVFDQDYRSPDNEHLIEIDETIFPADEQMIITRLLKAGVAPDVRHAMDVEDEILSEIEARDTVIMQKDQVIEQKDQQLEQKDQMLKETIKMLSQAGVSNEEIAARLAIPLANITSILL